MDWSELTGFRLIVNHTLSQSDSNSVYNHSCVTWHIFAWAFYVCDCRAWMNGQTPTGRFILFQHHSTVLAFMPLCTQQASTPCYRPTWHLPLPAQVSSLSDPASWWYLKGNFITYFQPVLCHCGVCIVCKWMFGFPWKHRLFTQTAYTAVSL